MVFLIKCRASVSDELLADVASKLINWQMSCDARLNRVEASERECRHSVYHYLAKSLIRDKQQEIMSDCFNARPFPSWLFRWWVYEICRVLDYGGDRTLKFFGYDLQPLGIALMDEVIV